MRHDRFGSRHERSSAAPDPSGGEPDPFDLAPKGFDVPLDRSGDDPKASGAEDEGSGEDHEPSGSRHERSSRESSRFGRDPERSWCEAPPAPALLQSSGAPHASHAWISAIWAEVTHVPPLGMLPPSDPHSGDALGSTSAELGALAPVVISPALIMPA